MKFDDLQREVLLAEQGVLQRIAQRTKQFVQSAAGAITGGVAAAAGVGGEQMSTSQKVANAKFEANYKDLEQALKRLQQLGGKDVQLPKWDRSKQQVLASIDLSPLLNNIPELSTAPDPVKALGTMLGEARIADGLMLLEIELLRKMGEKLAGASSAANFASAMQQLKIAIGRMKSADGYRGVFGGKVAQIEHDPAAKTLKLTLGYDFGGSGQLHDDMMALAKATGAEVDQDLEKDAEARAKLTPAQLFDQLQEGKLKLDGLTVAELQKLAAHLGLPTAGSTDFDELVKSISPRLTGEKIFEKLKPEEIAAQLKAGKLQADQLTSLKSDKLMAVVQAAGLKPLSHEPSVLIDQLKKQITAKGDELQSFLGDPGWRVAQFASDFKKYWDFMTKHDAPTFKQMLGALSAREVGLLFSGATKADRQAFTGGKPQRAEYAGAIGAWIQDGRIKPQDATRDELYQYLVANVPRAEIKDPLDEKALQRQAAEVARGRREGTALTPDAWDKEVARQIKVGIAGLQKEQEAKAKADPTYTPVKFDAEDFKELQGGFQGFLTREYGRTRDPMAILKTSRDVAKALDRFFHSGFVLKKLATTETEPGFDPEDGEQLAKLIDIQLRIAKSSANKHDVMAQLTAWIEGLPTKPNQAQVVAQIKKIIPTVAL